MNNFLPSFKESADEVAQLNKQVKKLIEGLIESQKEATNFQKNIKGVSGLKELDEAIDKAKKSTEQLTEEQKEAIKINEELIKAKNKQIKAARDLVAPYKEVSRELEENKKKVKDLTSQLSKLDKAGKSNTQEYKDLKKSIEDTKLATNKIIEEQKEAIKVKAKLEQANKALALSQTEEGKKLAELRVKSSELAKVQKEQAKEALGLITPYQKLSKELTENRNKAKDLGAQMLELERAGKKSSKEYIELSQAFDKAQKEVSQLDKDLKGLDQSLGQSQRNVGNYEEAINSAFSKFKSGDFFGGLKDVVSNVTENVSRGTIGFKSYSSATKDASSNIKASASGLNTLGSTIGDASESLERASIGFKTISNNAGESVGNVSNVSNEFKSFGSSIGLAARQLGAFILSPVGIVLGALSGIALVTKYFFDYNKEVRDANIQIERLANTSGDATNELRRNAQAITDAYGGDFTENVKALNELQRDFGLTSQEAFDVYNDGLAKGGAASSEFLDSIKEYGVFFEQAGFSAQEFVDVLNSGIDLGVYNDKLPDAIKEADLSLREQTKSTRDALINAFGSAFTDDILNGIKDGSKTTKDALFEISQESERVGINSQQAAQLTADVFRGAGEDVGGAIKVFEALNLAIESNKKPLTELEEESLALAESQRQLKIAKDEAFKSDTLLAFQGTFKRVWNIVQIDFFSVISGIRKGIENIVVSFQIIPKASKIIFEKLGIFISEAVKVYIDYFKELPKSVIDIFSSIGKIVKSALSGDFNSLPQLIKEAGKKISDSNPFAGVSKSIVNSGFGNIGNEIGLLFDEAKQKAKEKGAELRAEIEKNKIDNTKDNTNTNTKDNTNTTNSYSNEEDKELEKAIKRKELLLEQDKLYNQSVLDGKKNLDDELARIERQKQMEIELLELKSGTNEKEIEGKKDLTNAEIEFQNELFKIKENYRQQEQGVKDELEAIEAEKEANRLQKEEEKKEMELQSLADLLGVKKEKINEYENFIQKIVGSSKEKQADADNKLNENSKKVNQLTAAREKAVAIFNSTKDTIQGAGKAFNSQFIPGDPSSLARAIGAAALASVQGAARTAQLVSMAIPKFYKGTTNAPEGLAWTQEKGAEIITDKMGNIKSYGSNKGAELTYLSKGDKVFTAKETEMLMNTSPNIDFSFTKKSSNVIDYKRLGFEVSQAIKKDSHGLFAYKDTFVQWKINESGKLNINPIVVND